MVTLLLPVGVGAPDRLSKVFLFVPGDVVGDGGSNTNQ